MPHKLIIEAGRAERNYWRDLWCFRELFYFLAWRDILIRYKQTFIGVAWALLRPLITMVIFTFVFGRIASLPTVGSTPYALLVFSGLLPWTFFSTAMSEAANSLVSNANLISKIYFPRLIVPTSAVVTALVDFGISLGFLALLMAWYRFLPDWRLLTLPLWTLLASAMAIGTGLWLSALNVKYRDFRYIVPFIVQFGLFISPVGYTSEAVPGHWNLVFALNPMTGIINGFRWAILRGQSPLDVISVSISLGMTTLIMIFGIWYFRKTEKSFADVI